MGIGTQNRAREYDDGDDHYHRHQSDRESPDLACCSSTNMVSNVNPDITPVTRCFVHFHKG